MRIAKLELLAYGPFHRFTLDFSKGGLHIVLGRNEAGKSTTLRAITGLLYGIDAKTPDAHVHKFGDLRIAGVLENDRGESIRIVRRKGNTNTLLDDAERAIDESLLKKLLGGVSKETFTTAFGLDHDTLEAGARALLDGKGELGESLFDASIGGGGEVQRLLGELAAEADKIYKPRASSLPLNEALKSFAEAQKTVRERQSLPEAFLAQERAVTDASREREARLAEKSALVARKSRLERARRRLPLERRYQRAIEKHAELGTLAVQAARVDSLRDRFPAYDHAVAQRRVHQAEAERFADRVKEAARRAGFDPQANLDPLRVEGAPLELPPVLDARREARVHGLLRERTTLAQRLASTETEIAKHERELARLAPALEAPQDDDLLRAALDRARSLGDVEARLAAEKVKLDRKRSDLETRVGTLFDGPLDAFVALRVPAIATVEQQRERAAEIGRRLERLEERAADLRKEAASIAKQTAAESGDFAPPDAAALQKARSDRDAAWKALREAEEPARRSLEIETERLLREADALADRMIREADRVTTLARLRSEAAANERESVKVADEKTRVLEQQAALDGELAALLASAAGIKLASRSHAEVRHWLERHLRIVEAHTSLREAADAVKDEEVAVERAKRDLVSALGVGDAPLRELVALTTRKLASLDAARRAAEEARRAVVKLRTEIDERAVSRARDEAALADVKARLSELLIPLGVPADASADEVNRSLEALRDLFDAADKRADAEARARAADTEVRAFEGDLAQAIAELAPDLESMPRADAAQMLFARGAEAKANAQELETARAELEADAFVLDEAERELAANPEMAARTEQELADQIDDLEQQTTRLTEQIGGLRSGLEKMRVDSLASNAAADAQQALARVREGAERWSRVKLASLLLSREIERYREENQGPLLTSSSALFARLTLGAFAGIKAGFDEKDRPCLRCVRAGANAIEVDVAGLSDGTRDQLYLSLRLASLLRRAEAAEPMPLVLDDVLIQLDDQRASAALAVLAEIARRMQVLLFTHHARIVDLARSAVPANELVVHEIGGQRSAISGQLESAES